MFSVPAVAHLSNQALVDQLQRLAKRSHEITAELLVHLAEVDERKLYLGAACGSMFDYVTRALGFSEAAALKRIHAARTGKKFPRVLELLAEGSLHLAGVELLGPHLTEDNQHELLSAASGKSKRAIEGIVAGLAPKPDVAAGVRKLPTPQAGRPGASTEQPRLGLAPTDEAGSGCRESQPAAASPEPPKREEPPRQAARLATRPLSADRYQVTFTASAALADKLAQCKALLGHREPGCDQARVVELAVEMLYEQLLKERFGVGARPRASRQSDERTRHVPKELRREVVARDGLSCAFVDPKNGRRCGSTDRLELQHHQPFARGGLHSAENISLFCHAHNAHAAGLDFGHEHIENAIRARSRDRSLRREAALSGGT